MPVLEQIWSNSAPLDIKDSLVDYFIEGSIVDFVQVADNTIHIRTWDISTAAHHSFGVSVPITVRGSSGYSRHLVYLLTRSTSTPNTLR
jgi:hypothetical protein